MQLITRTIAFVVVGLGFAKLTLKDMEKDSPYIACQVCKFTIENLFDAVANERNEAPYKKIDEGQIQEIIDTVCQADHKNGEWLRKIDITSQKKKDGTFINLETPGGISKCGVECQLIGKSCSALLQDEIDADDLSAALWKNKMDVKTLKNEACKTWSDRCTSKPKPISYIRADEPFTEISEKDLQMEQLMASMKAAGMGGMNMYNKDDMENMMGGPGGMDPYADPYGEMGDMDPYGGMGNNMDFEM